jgi:hypothetical protein
MLQPTRTEVIQRQRAGEEVEQKQVRAENHYGITLRS